MQIPAGTYEAELNRIDELIRSIISELASMAKETIERLFEFFERMNKTFSPCSQKKKDSKDSKIQIFKAQNEFDGFLSVMIRAVNDGNAARLSRAAGWRVEGCALS